MKTITTKCFILGHKNFGEADKLIFLYSKDLGKIKAVAKGARKITSKFTGHLETLNFCIVSLYFGPRNTIITEILTEKVYLKQNSKLNTLSNAIQIAEITNQVLFENQTLDNLTTLLKTTLKFLTQSTKTQLISTAYIIKLLDKTGIIPDFKELQTKIETKYLKFFNFIKEKTFEEIIKINLTKEEKSYIQKFIKTLIQQETKIKLINLN